MEGDLTLDEFLAEQLGDPEFAAAWAIQRPLGSFGLNVWSLRESSGMTQQQLATAAKMKQPRIAEIERGDANPTLLTISRIAFALGVSADRLLAEPDEALLARARAVVVETRAAGRTKRPSATKARTDSGRVQERAPRRRRATA